MSALREQIESRLREEISVLYWRDHPPADGAGPPDELPFPLKSRLDAVIDIIAGAKDFSLEPYQEKVREIVCSTCRQDGSGACSLREEGECSLEAYFPKIVAIIEKELEADPGIA